MDLDRISKMKVEELKDFLRLRGLKVSGKKEELVARVFVAAENDVPILKTAVEVQAEIAEDYDSKLLVEGVRIPDPFAIANGWVPEDESVKLWPMTLYPDIFNFLSFYPSELKSQDLNDYKLSKAYSYYSTGWLNPLSYHPVSESSTVCVLKSACKQSQRINDTPHKLWVCLAKKSGKILKAHCTCMAGIGQTCNHVAAALFRIEAAVRMGLTNPSCTTTACEWLPNNKAVRMTRIKDLKLSRAKFGKQSKKQSELNCSPKKRFDPTANISEKLSFMKVSTAIRNVCTEDESIIFTAEPKVCTVENVPKARELHTIDEFLCASETQDEFCLKLEYFPANLADIEEETRGQAANPLWFSVRQHVISASKAHDVKTRMTSFKTATGDKEAYFKNLIDKIAGRKRVNPLLPPLRYGQAMENNAVQMFVDLYKESHQNVKVEECGIFLCMDIPFVGGSPDRIICCDCCGKFCLEVKCPYSFSHLSPMDSDVKLPYLKKDASMTTSLNRNHKYYTQIQVQMAASRIYNSYFFVWTSHGYFLEKLSFDIELWEILKEQFKEFYFSHYLPSFFMK